MMRVNNKKELIDKTCKNIDENIDKVIGQMRNIKEATKEIENLDIDHSQDYALLILNRHPFGGNIGDIYAKVNDWEPDIKKVQKIVEKYDGKILVHNESLDNYLKDKTRYVHHVKIEIPGQKFV